MFIDNIDSLTKYIMTTWIDFFTFRNPYGSLLDKKLSPAVQAVKRYLASLEVNPESLQMRNELKQAFSILDKRIGEIYNQNLELVPIEDRTLLRDCQDECAKIVAQLSIIAKEEELKEEQM